MRITKIENQKKRPGRKNIYADDEFLAGVSAETLIKLRLRVGDDVSPAQVSVLRQLESLNSAKNTALRFLSARPRSEREVRNKLREKEFSDSEIESTLADLRNSSLLDDREFARMFIRNALALRPVGQAVLKQKLLLLGVDRATVEESLQEAMGEADQAGAAETLAREFVRKARAVRKAEPPGKLRNRLAGYLGRRGYSWDIIRSAMRSALGGNE